MSVLDIYCFGSPFLGNIYSPYMIQRELPLFQGPTSLAIVPGLGILGSESFHFSAANVSLRLMEATFHLRWKNTV